LTVLAGEVCFTQQQWMASKKKKSRKPAWRLDEVMKGHAVANGDVTAANRIGLEQYSTRYGGNSVLGIFLYWGPQEF
jgi:hypothetical protein